MAKNYTFNEAVAIIAEGKDLETLTDIGRRYPVLLHKVATVAAKAGSDFVDLMGYMPDYLTANKVNAAIKAGITESDSGEGEEDTGAAEATEAVAAETTGVDYESMSAKQLWDILGKAGLRKTAKSTKKPDLVEACKAMDANKGKKVEAEAEADEETEGTNEPANPYEGKSAMDLFKECKKRGIKAVPKKSAKFYADLLMKDDAKAAEKPASKKTEQESGDWDDEDEAEESKPVKEEKKPAKAAKKAPAKAAEDEDDDWEI